MICGFLPELHLEAVLARVRPVRSYDGGISQNVRPRCIIDRHEAKRGLEGLDIWHRDTGERHEVARADDKIGRAHV